MNTTQMREATELARNSTNGELWDVDISILHGCALADFKPVSTTLRVVARMIQYQCIQLNGEFDTVELNSLANIFRRKVTII